MSASCCALVYAGKSMRGSAGSTRAIGYMPTCGRAHATPRGPRAGALRQDLSQRQARLACLTLAHLACALVLRLPEKAVRPCMVGEAVAHRK